MIRSAAGMLHLMRHILSIKTLSLARENSKLLLDSVLMTHLSFSKGTFFRTIISASSTIIGSLGCLDTMLTDLIRTLNWMAHSWLSMIRQFRSCVAFVFGHKTLSILAYVIFSCWRPALNAARVVIRTKKKWYVVVVDFHMTREKKLVNIVVC